VVASHDGKACGRVHDFRPRIGDHRIRVIGVMGFPMESVPEVLGFLNRLPPPIFMAFDLMYHDRRDRAAVA
jgi:hypothetical protein